MYNIPLFDLNYGDEEVDAINRVLEDKWISCGPRCEKLEKIMQEMLGVKYALTTSNCTAALHLALLTAGISCGDEVIVPSLTFVATVNAVRYVGATPVFCDIESIDKPIIDPAEIEKHISNKTKAIIVMHYAGFACDMDRIVNIANRNDVVVIEDACHGPLSEYHGRKLGTIGEAGCFSFFSNKNISTGEGGAIVTNDETIYKKAKLLRSHGMTSMSYERSTGHAVQYDVVDLGYNYRMDDIRAALGIVQFEKLKEDIAKRMVVRNRYIERLEGVDEIAIPFADYGEMTSSYIFPTVLVSPGQYGSSKRDRIREYLKDFGIQTSVHYPAVNRFKIYIDYSCSALPKTEYVSDNEISLPMYGSLTDENIDYICDVYKKSLREIKE